MKQKIVVKVALVFALLLSAGVANAQKSELPVFSAGSSLKGTLEKISIFYNGPKEVWGFAKNEDGDPFPTLVEGQIALVAFRDVNGNFYDASAPASDYFLFAK